MKNTLFLIISLSLIFSGCTGSSGGTTQDNPPIPTPPIIIPPGQPSQFNIIQSNFKILDNSETEITVAGVGQPFKLRLTAKDQYGNLMSGLNIKFSRISIVSPDLIPTEISPGVYESSFVSNDQLSEEFSVMKDSLSVSLNKTVFISFCAGSSSVSALPFFNSTVQSGTTYYIICNAQQLSSAQSFLTRNYILGVNLDLNTFYVDANSNQIPDNQFKIGNSTTPYTGIFKGYGLVIRNFRYINNSESDIGLFGKLSSGASLSRVILDSPLVSGASKVGSLVGSIETASSGVLLDGVSVLNGQNVSTSGNDHGGIIGYIDGTLGMVTIENSSGSTLIDLNNSTSPRSRVGGAIGYVKNASISQNYFDSSVTFDDKSNSVTDLGGIIGKMENVSFYNVSSNSTIAVNSGTNVGGLIGSIDNSFLDSLSSNTVSLNFTGTTIGDFSKVGGMFGNVNNSSLLTITGFITSTTAIKDSFGGVAHTLDNTSATKVILNGSFIFESDNVGGMYSSLISSSLNKNWNYLTLSSSTSQSNIAGISASIEDSFISNSNFEGQIVASNSSQISGIASVIVGTNTIDNSSFKGLIEGLTSVSGIIGQSLTVSGEKTTIENSYSSGSLTATDLIAGIALQISDPDEIKFSFVTSLIRDSVGNPVPNYASLVLNRTSSSTLNSIRYLSSRSGTIACGGAMACSGGTDILDTDTNSANDLNYYFSQSNSPMNTWDFSNIWNSFGDLPVLRY